MFEHGFPPYWSTIKKLIWLVGTGIVGGVTEIWKTVTGTIIHITDALEAPMQKCEVTLEPIQDLHGQDAPYPAGGGKNLCYIEDFSDTIRSVNISATNNVLTLNGTADGTIGANSTEWKRIKFKITTEGRYAISFYPSLPAGLGYYIYDSSMSTVSLYQNVPVGDYTIGLYIPGGTSLNTTIQFQIEAGTTPTPFSPYSNICPITGWTGCEVTRTGANLLGGQTFAEAFSTCNGYTIDTTNKTFTFNRSGQIVSPIKFKDNTQYTFIFSALADVRNNNIRIHYTDGSSTWVDINTTVKSTIVAVSTLGKTVSGISVAWGVYSDTATVWYEESGIFEGVLTADDFEPYSGTTLSVTFPALGNNLFDKSATRASQFSDIDVSKVVYCSANVAGSTVNNALKFASSAHSLGVPVSVGDSVKIYFFDGLPTSTRQYYAIVDSDGIVQYASSYTVSTTASFYTGTIEVSLAGYLILEWGLDNTANDGIVITKNEVSALTSYEPYTNAVYGGTVDLVSGLLTVDRILAVLTNTMAWEKGATNTQTSVFFLSNAVVSDKSPASWDSVETIANWAMKSTAKSTEAAHMVNGRYYWTTADGYWRVGYGTPDTTVDEFKAFLQTNPLQVVCPIATPINYQLTPQEISTLAGENNIWGDGTITAIYKATE